MSQIPTPGGEKLSASDAEALATHISQVSSAGLSLAAGLQAAAAEADSAPLRRTLRALATSIEQGTSLSQAIEQHGRRLPPHLTGILQASANSSRLGVILAEWIENQRTSRMHWRTITAALMYPLVTVVLTVGVFLFIAMSIVPQLRTMFDEFGLKLSPMNWMMLHASEAGGKILAGVVIVVVIGALAIRLIGGRATWSRVLRWVPLVGNPWHWTGSAEMLRVLSLLVEERTQLAAALVSTSQGISDAYLGQVCRRLAGDVQQGLPLWQAIERSGGLPLSIVPLVRWGEQNDLLAEGLRTAAEMLEGRLRSGSQLLVIVLPPLVFLGVASMILSLASSVLLPMIALIQGLT